MQTIYNSLALNPAVEEIRIVRINPGSGKDIFCELEKLILPQPETNAEGELIQPTKADYTALSYTWELKPTFDFRVKPWKTQNQYETICCNGVSLAVLPNLHAALLQLRDEITPTVLWIDAICINQKDKDEKSSQVKLMGKIYTLARKTVVWLGDGTYVSRKGFQGARFIAGIMRRSHHSGNMNHQEGHRNPLSGLLSFIPHLRLFWHVWAFVYLLQNTYFTRIWIVQEIAFSTSLEFRAGDDCMSLGDFGFAAALLPFSNIGSKNSMNLTNILAVKYLVRGQAQDGEEDPSRIHAEAVKENLSLRGDILSTMILFRGSEATDQKDKIFGLLGLCSQMEDAQTFGVEVDYSLSPTEVYVRTASSILKKKRNLDIFAALHRQQEGEGKLKLPSWVPDWSDTKLIAVPINNGSGNHATIRNFQCNPYSPILHLPGHIIDKITEIGPLCHTEKAQASIWFCFKTTFNFSGSHRLQTLVNWWTQFGEKSSASQEFMDALTCGLEAEYSTISMMKLIKRFQQRSVLDLPILLILLWIFIPLRASFLYFEPTLERLHIIALQCLAGPITLLLITYVSFAMWPRLIMFKLTAWERNFYDNGLKYMEGRIMARTEKGRLALVPDGTQVRDLVATCQDGTVPLVLRKTSTKGEFEIVGEGYIHGVMDGMKGYDEEQYQHLLIV